MVSAMVELRAFLQAVGWVEMTVSEKAGWLVIEMAVSMVVVLVVAMAVSMAVE